MTSDVKPLKSRNFYLEPPYLYLLNPDMLPVRNILQFPLVRILKEFFDKMKELSELDYKIMGLCLKSTARIHRMRVSKAISFEKEMERDYEIKKKKEEFIVDKPLKQYLKRPETHFTSESASDAFYEQLMVSLRSEGIKRERKRKRTEILEISDEIGEDEDLFPKKLRRKRRITVKKSAVFDAVIIDFDRIDIDILINEVLYAIRKFSREKIGQEEVLFEDIIQHRVKGSTDVEKRKLEQVRILISLLHLIKEGFVEAWQDLDTNEITIIVTTRGMEETFGFKPLRDESEDN